MSIRHSIEQFAQEKTVLVRAVAWGMAILMFINALVFVWKCSNPVLRSDDWYFLDVFLRKAINHNLELADFFVKRRGADHAQPMFKAALFIEWKYFDLDVSWEAVIGVFAAAISALIVHKFIFHGRIFSGCVGNDGLGRPGYMSSYLAWITICAVLFSLNSTGIWTWPLVTIEYLTFIPMLTFILAVWNSLQGGNLLWLAASTLFLGMADDDNAIIAVLAITLAVLVALVSDPGLRRGRILLKMLLIVAGCMAIVRVGYAYMPVRGGFPKKPILEYFMRLYEQAGNSHDWWKWVVLPLLLSVSTINPFVRLPNSIWLLTEAVIVAFLLASHVWFWICAIRGRQSLAKFAAISLMILVYGWLAGVLLYRVAFFGSDYLNQGRYIRFYQFNLVALLLMWTGVPRRGIPPKTTLWRADAVFRVACALLLVLQVPLSRQAWHSRRYILPYYQKMADQLRQLSTNPAATQGCVPELVICGDTLARRRDLVGMLAANHLNVFSPSLQRRHSFIAEKEPRP